MMAYPLSLGKNKSIYSPVRLFPTAIRLYPILLNLFASGG
jgi:hypothetical protein